MTQHHVVLSGRADRERVAALLPELAAAPADAPLVLDLTAATEVDSVMLGAIAAEHRRRAGGRNPMVLRCRPGSLHDLLVATGLGPRLSAELA